MIKVAIPVGLERRLRAGADPASLVKELLGLVDQAHALKDGKEAPSGPGYQEILGWFRAGLGRELAAPAQPSSTYIIRIIRRVRELGLDADGVSAVCDGVKRLYPGRANYDIEFLVKNATTLSGGNRGDAAGPNGKHRADVIYHGRPEGDDTSSR